MDKKLSTIELSLEQQTSLVAEVNDLRKEVNQLKVDVATKSNGEWVKEFKATYQQDKETNK
jgi:hypothetical protein